MVFRPPHARRTLGRYLVVAVSLALCLSAVPGALATARAQSVPTASAGAHALELVSARDQTDRQVDGQADRQTQGATVQAARVGRYQPKTGVLTIDPRSSSKRRILNHILDCINSTRAGQTIRIISWNVASPSFVRELLQANERGVSVRLLMAKEKALEQPSSGDFWRLRRGLRHRSRTHPQPDRLKSWARYCEFSCRGNRGIAHSKFFVFSRVGKVKNVVISTSANATEVSVNAQWNDAYTLTGNVKIYEGFLEIFRESARDKPVAKGFRTFRSKFTSAYFFPWKGHQARGDRVMSELKRIRCSGATGGTGIGGHTSIRIAMDAILDDRGIMIAKKLRSMYESGCNIKIVYALLGGQVKWYTQHTSRGPIPIRHIVSDFDDDGVYDRYLHSKVLSVSGVYGRDTSARVAWQGSENWSGLAKLSDEQGMKVWRGGAQKNYDAWIDWLFAHPPVVVTPTIRAARARGVDPYRIIKANLD